MKRFEQHDNRGKPLHRPDPITRVEIDRLDGNELPTRHCAIEALEGI